MTERKEKHTERFYPGAFNRLLFIHVLVVIVSEWLRLKEKRAIRSKGI